MSDRFDDSIGEGPAFERELPKAGSCGVRVWRTFNVGLQPGYKGGPPQPKVLVYFILPYKYTEGEYKGKRMLAWQKYTAGFGKRGPNNKSYLRRDVQAILNREIGDDELPFKMSELWGAPCLIQIVHENGYANIKTVMSLPEGMPPLPKDPGADPDDKYVPNFVVKLREASVVQERKDTDRIADKAWEKAAPEPSRPPTKEEQDIF